MTRKISPPTPVNSGRHAAECKICAHPQRDEIERDFVNWRSPASITKQYGLRNRSTVYRHAHAVGLFPKRQRNVRAALENIIERAAEVEVNVQMEGAPMRTKKNQELDPESPQNAAPLDPEATPPAGPQIATGKRCQGRDKRDMPCTAWAVKGGTRCYFHANPEKVSELGRRGGEAKGPGGARYAERSLKTVDDVTALLGDTIKDLGMGRIDPKEATAVGYP